MNPPLSNLGIFHTVISVLAIIVALFDLLRNGRIDTSKKIGKAYVWGTALACLSTFGIYRFGHPGPGHALSVLAIVCLALAYWASSKRPNRWILIDTLALTTSILFSLIPATIETLTRLPLGHPWATGPEDLLVKKSLGILFAVFALSALLQIKVFRTKVSA